MKPAGQMTLTRELEHAFASSSEYVRDLIRERYLKERDRAAKLSSLDAALVRGLADAEAGRVAPLDDAFRRLRAELELPDSPDPE